MTYWTKDGANASTGQDFKQERYTPQWLADEIESFWHPNGIELDPCSPGVGFSNINAYLHYTRHDNGLELPWNALTVFANPPYGRGKETGTEPWIRKAISEHNCRNATEIILLIPNRTSNSWYSLLDPYPRMEFVGRLFFDGLDENGRPLTQQAPFPSALFYMGYDEDRFCEYFSRWGRVLRVTHNMEGDNEK